MMTVVIYINNVPIVSRSARNVEFIEDDTYRYKVDDGQELIHKRSDGAIKLAINMLKNVKTL